MNTRKTTAKRCKYRRDVTEKDYTISVRLPARYRSLVKKLAAHRGNVSVNRLFVELFKADLERTSISNHNEGVGSNDHDEERTGV